MPSFCILLGLGLSLATSFSATPAPNRLIVPGRSLGNLRLGENSATALPPLGKASAGDAAMQKAWGTWYGRKPANGSAPTQLDVYTAPQNNDVDNHTVQVVRATSSWFQLANGLSAGSRLSTIRAVYGRLPLATSYRLAAGNRYLYDDVQKGVAFEIDGTASSSRCRAIIVHVPGKAVTSTYLSMATYLKDLPKK